MKRTLVIATLTAGTVITLSGSLLPDEDRTTPAGQQHALEEQYSGHRERQLEDSNAERRQLEEAIERDHLRPAEERAAGSEVERAMERGILRRLP